MSVAFAALPAHSAPAPANSVIASFLIGFSLLVAALWLKDLPPHLFPRKPTRKSKQAGTTQRRVPLSARSLLRPIWNSARPGSVTFSPLGYFQGEEHEGTFVDYDRHRPDAWNRRICPIPKRAAEIQFTSRGAKPDQFEFVGAVDVLVDLFFAEFDALRPERPIDAFRGSEIADHDRPVGA